VSLNQADVAVRQQSLHTFELPGTRTPGVFVDEVQSISELMPIQCNAELNMLRGLLLLLVERSEPLGIVSMYVLIKFLKITKQRAWGGSFYHIRYRFPDQFPCPDPIVRAAEVPAAREVE
jgi:hypothetical protein